MSEIEIRASTLTDIDTKLRLIDVIAVPWEQETEVFWNGEVWREVFTRGAFSGVEDHAGRIRVNREHVRGDTVGKVVHLEDIDLGLLARVKVAETPRGDETLALAEEDMVSASVGFRIKDPVRDVQVNKRTRTRRILRAFLDHLAMVEAPAYAGAQVLAVRADQPGLPAVEQKPLPETPVLDEFRNSEALAWALDRLAGRS